jgi:hypothetical protein
MAKAPSNVTGWAGDGAVWFKVYQITATTNGGSSISFPAQSMFYVSYLEVSPNIHAYPLDVPSVSFTLPKSLPSGQYLGR